MKKITALLLAVFSVLSLAACGRNFEPKYDEVTYPLYEEVPEKEDTSFKEFASEPTDEVRKKVEETYFEICEFYKIDKPVPQIKVLDEDVFERIFSVEYEAFYHPETKTIYLHENKISSKWVIVHELLHYLSDNGEKRGFIYEAEANKERNNYFNEGATEYLTIKLLGEKHFGPYDFQRLFAHQIALVVGEENFEKAYFTSDDSEVREFFNSSVKDFYKGVQYDSFYFDAWDEMACNCCAIWLFQLQQPLPEDFFNIIVRNEEEIIYMALKNDKGKEVKAELKELLMDEFKFTKAECEVFELQYLLDMKLK